MPFRHRLHVPVTNRRSDSVSALPLIYGVSLRLGVATLEWVSLVPGCEKPINKNRVSMRSSEPAKRLAMTSSMKQCDRGGRRAPSGSLGTGGGG